jgi:hypothetical protein
MALTASLKLSGNVICIINIVMLYMLDPAEAEHKPAQLLLPQLKKIVI